MAPTCNTCKVNNVHPTKNQPKNGPIRYKVRCDECTKKHNEDWYRFKYGQNKPTRSIATQTDSTDEEAIEPIIDDVRSSSTKFNMTDYKSLKRKLAALTECVDSYKTKLANQFAEELESNWINSFFINQSAMSSSHPVPVQVTDTKTGLRRDATDEEFAKFKLNRQRYGKWLYSNRKFIHDQLVQDGVDDKLAWARAFDQYPKTESTNQRGFLFNPDE